MKNYQQELDALFNKWEEVSKKDGLIGFCRDGLLNKGDFHSEKRADMRTYWGRKRGKEDELWHNAPKRILFLLKDPNKNPEDDMRTWMGRQHRTIITGRFWKNIAMWLYGMNEIQQNGTYVPFDKANNPVVFSKAYDDLPISIVNVKKESGGSTVRNETLIQYARKYGCYLKAEMEILNPNIVVCGGGRGTVLQIAQGIIYPQLKFERINDLVYFNKDMNIILISCCHPSCRMSYKELYEKLMKSLQQHFETTFTRLRVSSLLSPNGRHETNSACETLFLTWPYPTAMPSRNSMLLRVFFNLPSSNSMASTGGTPVSARRRMTTLLYSSGW
jgi:hypothetical protein